MHTKAGKNWKNGENFILLKDFRNLIMENLGIGLQLMLVGMITVFLILIIVITGSRLLIRLINRIAPEQEQKKAPAGEDYTAVFEAAVAQLTDGKGKLTKITKL